MSQTPNSASQQPSLPPNLPQSYHILYQKQQEHAGLQALKEASAEMVERVEKLAEMSNIMADGGEAIGQVLRNWPHVFSILNLFEQPPPRPVSPNGTMLVHEDEEQEPLPQLVRLPYNNEQQQQQTK